MLLGYPLAAPLGGGPDDAEVAYQALLTALDPGINKDDPVNQAMAWAEAVEISNAWAAVKRLKNQMYPPAMQETLPTWEQACSLRPGPTDTLVARRAAVGARFLGFAGNDLAQLYQVVQQLAGNLFLGFATPTQQITYLPGAYPGPPGFEWFSTNALLAVRLQPPPVASDLRPLMQKIQSELQLMAPGWNQFVIGTDQGGFLIGDTVGAGVMDVTLL